MIHPIDDVRIAQIKTLLPPSHFMSQLPLAESVAEQIYASRLSIQNIIHGQDPRLLVVVGPCSIHDPLAALEYADRLVAVREKWSQELFVVMRVYFEKPRTTVGWKGLINDPGINDRFDINEGLRLARQLLLNINEMGIPAGSEFLDLITPQYFADLISWGAIGARTTESQVHRELASGLSCPVGFKNGTDGNLKIAMDAVRAAGQPHHFLSVTKAGQSAIVATKGNSDCHVILRGGKLPNYDNESVLMAIAELEKNNLPPRVMIDFSHANSGKNPQNQMKVGEVVGQQIRADQKGILGVMIESHLVGGRQDLCPGVPLRYGQSITDGCLSFAETEILLADLALSQRVGFGLGERNGR